MLRRFFCRKSKRGPPRLLHRSTGNGLKNNNNITPSIAVHFPALAVLVCLCGVKAGRVSVHSYYFVTLYTYGEDIWEFFPPDITTFPPFPRAVQTTALCDITEGQFPEALKFTADGSLPHLQGWSRKFFPPAAQVQVSHLNNLLTAPPPRLPFFPCPQERPINLSSSERRETAALSTGLPRILTGSCHGNRRLLPCVV